MKLFINRTRSNIEAQAEYLPEEGTFTVLKGSKISGVIAYTEKFRGSKSIEKSRAGVVDGNVVTKNVTFKSASTAANFVTGSSTNGRTAWKDANGKKLKDILADKEA